MCTNIEPLATRLWFQRIAVIATGNLGSIENSLRHAAHLVQLAPTSFRKVLPQILDESLFEALLESADFDASARLLFASPTTLFIETSADDSPLRAVVRCAVLKRSVDCTGDTAASAILGAWAKWLVTLRFEFGSDLEDDPAPVGDGPLPICKSACPGLN